MNKFTFYLHFYYCCLLFHFLLWNLTSFFWSEMFEWSFDRYKTLLFQKKKRKGKLGEDLRKNMGKEITQFVSELSFFIAERNGIERKMFSKNNWFKKRKNESLFPQNKNT